MRGHTAIRREVVTLIFGSRAAENRFTDSDWIEAIAATRALSYRARGFQTRVERLLAARDHVASSLVVCDLDSFKPINDRFGRIVGDEVLCDLCVLLRASARESDVVGRIGGDEFAIYLTGSAHRDAVDFSERIRDDLSRAQFRALPGTESITASFGVGTTIAGMEFIDLLCAADNQLYEAKERWRRSKAPTSRRNQRRTDISGGLASNTESA